MIRREGPEELEPLDKETESKDRLCRGDGVGVMLVCLWRLNLRKPDSGWSVTTWIQTKKKAFPEAFPDIPDIPSSVVRPLVERGFLKAVSRPDLLQMDVVVVCVPTPLGKSKDPDISFIVTAANVLARTLRKGQLIILESTTYPGTTRELILPTLEAKGLRAGRDFFLAFSPERIDPGNAHFKLGNTPKIVSGFTSTCRDVAMSFYSRIASLVVPVSSLETAEMTKLLENTFRAVNIALANEVALMCNRLQLNVWEVIEAAATKPFGYMKFFPGPGIGGHCIPLDPHYLSWKLKTLDFTSRFIDLAEDVNSFMPRYVVDRLMEALNSVRKSVRGARVLLLGVAYKKDISDVRESPALRIIEELERLGARLIFSDPFVSRVEVGGREVQREEVDRFLVEGAGSCFADYGPQ